MIRMTFFKFHFGYFWRFEGELMIRITLLNFDHMQSDLLTLVLKQAEKNELREEKLKLKADKEKMEQELKAISVPPPGFMATHPAAYQSAMSKMPVFPGYSLVPMWQYMPSSARDTSQDHKLRPPAA